MKTHKSTAYVCCVALDLTENARRRLEQGREGDCLSVEFAEKQQAVTDATEISIASW
jgi:hypothetical protein